MDKELEKVFNQLASNSEHWKQIKEVLQSDMRDSAELIRLIDAKIAENEKRIQHLN